MDLTEFFKARMDEEEAAARAATPGPWKDCGGYVTAPGSDAQVTDYGTQGDEQGAADSAHIARHNPARGLCEVAAMRAVLADYEGHVRSFGEGLSVSRRRLVLAFVAIWSDHPDYRQEWAPES